MTNNDKPVNKSRDRLNGTTTLKVAHILDEFEKDDVKKQIDIIELFAHYGVELKKKGKNYIGICPWHKDTNPSLSVDQAKGVYNCFGCGESGDIFTLTEKTQNMEFKEAMAYLKNWKRPAGEAIPAKIQRASELIPNTSTPPEKGGVEKQQAAEETNASRTRVGFRPPVSADTGASMHGAVRPRVVAQLMPSPTATGELNAESPLTPEGGMIVSDEKQESSFMLNEVADYYHKKLYDNKEAIDYLHQRGLVTPALWVRYKIGYADGTLPEKIGKQQREQLTAQGIFTVPGKEHFNGCLVFPIPDEVDNTIGIYGRAIGGTSSVTHLYLKGPHKGVFNRKASTVYDEIIITESIIDALSLIELGIDNVQPIYGTNGFTEEHLKLLQNDRVKTIILALDNDQAGRDASEKLKAKLLAEGFAIKEIFPEMPSRESNKHITEKPSPAGEVALAHPVLRDIGTSCPADGQRPGEVKKVKDWNDYLLNGGTKETVKDQVAQAENFYIEPDNAPRVEKTTAGYICESGDVIYRVTGVKEQFVNNLRVNIKATIQQTADDDINHIRDPYYDNVDLYSARSRENYTRNLAARFSVEEKRAEKDLIAILEYLERERDKQIQQESCTKETPVLTEEEKELGMAFLRNPNMFTEIEEDMTLLGYVGEERNKKLAYIIAVTRTMEEPISLIITSQSASGKSLLLDTVEKLMPPEDVLSVSSFSDKVLNYAKNLNNKFMTIGEAVHKEEIEYQLREIQSKKKLTRFVTKKDPKTGEMESVLVETEASMSIAMTTTNQNVNPENASRCFIITIDESKEQTKRIYDELRKKFTEEEYDARKKLIPEIAARHQAAGRLLKPYKVFIPYNRLLEFPLPEGKMRLRRDFGRFLQLIAGVAYLRQYQKEIVYRNNEPRIIADLADYTEAYDIMVHGVLQDSMTDIQQGAYEFYERVRLLARKLAKENNIEPAEVNMTQREIRDYTGFGQTWVKQQLRQLVEYEYMLLVRGGSARTKGHYRLVADEPLDRIDLSMILTPEDLEKIFYKEETKK